MRTKSITCLGFAWPKVQLLQDLEDRYNRLRLEVQLAADKGEAAGEAELIRRAMAKEKTANPVKGFFGASRYLFRKSSIRVYYLTDISDRLDDAVLTKMSFISVYIVIMLTCRVNNHVILLVTSNQYLILSSPLMSAAFQYCSLKVKLVTVAC